MCDPSTHAHIHWQNKYESIIFQENIVQPEQSTMVLYNDEAQAVLRILVMSLQHHDSENIEKNHSACGSLRSTFGVGCIKWTCFFFFLLPVITVLTVEIKILMP